MSSGEEGEVEEGQLVPTPGDGSRTSTPSVDRNRRSNSPRMSHSTRVTTRKSRSKSPTKNRNRSRSRSLDRSNSRDGRRRGDRRRSRSGSRDSYHGPIIRDMRRGRGGRGNFNRFDRGGRRGNRRFGRRDRDRFHSRSRSRSRSGTPPRDREPKVITPVKESPVQKSERKSESPQPKGAQPSDIKNLSKAETTTFLAMLQQKKVNKLIPINIKSKNPENEGSHGFVSTFATVGQKNPSQQSPRSSSETGEMKVDISVEDEVHEVERKGEQGKESATNGSRKRSHSRSSSESDRDKSSSRKKSKKHKHRKKSKRRKKHESESDSGDDDKKKVKRKSGEGTDKKEDKKETSKDDSKKGEEKKKDKKRKRKRRHRSSSEKSDRVKSSKKKSKKHKSEKKKKKRKRSSSESESSDEQSESKERKSGEKKKVDKSSKSKHRSSPEVKPVELEIPVAKSSVTGQVVKESEDLDDNSFEFPRSISRYTKTLPTLQYCRNPRTLLMDPSTDIISKSKVVIPLEPEKDSKVKENRGNKQKNESSKKVKDSPGDTLTPSERRNLEKKKKEEQQKSIDVNPTVEKSAAASNYYRSKKEDAKKEKDDEEKPIEKEGKKDEKKAGDEITSIKRASKPMESEGAHKKKNEPEETIEEKKKKLLEKVREKKEVAKGGDGDRSQKRADMSSMIGKIPKKKGPAASTKNPINMNNDYSYYQQNYIYNYGYDIYTAAYYAQYMMVTSGDYSQDEIKRWLESNGYKYDYTTGQEMPQLPPTESSDTSQQTSDDKESQPIAVIVPNVPAAAHEMYYQSPQSDSMDVDSEDDGGVTPPPPPPPPPEPQITTLTVTEPFSLPDGTSVPSGTKQVIVHPYSDTHPFASEFTPEAISSKIESMKQSGEDCSNGFLT